MTHRFALKVACLAAIIAKMSDEPTLNGNQGRRRPRHRRIRAISIAPALVTLGNLLFGFAAIHFCTRDYSFEGAIIGKWQPSNLAFACYLIFAALLCDALDGRLARMARSTSEFGAQLDSLADVVSFGLAPAVIAIQQIMQIVQTQAGPQAVVSPLGESMFGRFCWLAAGAYVACGAMRLARFNVENEEDISRHMDFKGLPIPGAAGALVSLILLNNEVLRDVFDARHLHVFAVVLPLVLIGLGLLMVSRIPFIHVPNRYLRGKKPFWMLVAFLLAMLAFWLWPQLVAVVGMCGFAISGPVLWVYGWLHKRHSQE